MIVVSPVYVIIIINGSLKPHSIFCTTMAGICSFALLKSITLCSFSHMIYKDLFNSNAHLLYKE
jgi:hypothetical protein